jgi:acetylglutamate kinase
MSTVVVKIGGNALESAVSQRDALAHLAKDICSLQQEGVSVVVVHGGGPAIAEALGERGLVSTFIDGLRVTDATALTVVNQALGGLTNQITASLVHAGCPAVGMSPVSAGTAKGVATSGPWGFVAENVVVDAHVLVALWREGYVPVLSSVVLSSDGELLNANADAVAGALAAAVGAETLVLLSDVAALRLDPDDPSSAVPSVSSAQVHELIASGAIRDGMLPKMRAALQAIDAGAQRVTLAHGGVPGALRAALSNDDGTEILK